VGVCIDLSEKKIVNCGQM